MSDSSWEDQCLNLLIQDRWYQLQQLTRLLQDRNISATVASRRISSQQWKHTVRNAYQASPEGLSIDTILGLQDLLLREGWALALQMVHGSVSL